MLLILLQVMHNTKVHFKCPILEMKTFHLLEMFNFQPNLRKTQGTYWGKKPFISYIFVFLNNMNNEHEQ